MDGISTWRVISTDADCKYCDIATLEDAVLSGLSGTAVPSFGAMVEGWLLVFPARHVLSVAELSETECADFEALVEEARHLVEERYGPTVQFEHGSAGVGRLAACGVDHAHVHVVPLVIDLRRAIAALDLDLEFGWESVDSRVQMPRASDYVYLSDSTGAWVSYHQWLPGQVVRRAIAKSLGIEEWDWKQNARMSIVEATRARLRSA